VGSVALPGSEEHWQFTGDNKPSDNLIKKIVFYPVSCRGLYRQLIVLYSGIEIPN